MLLLIGLGLLAQIATIAVAVYLLQFSRARLGWICVIGGLVIMLTRRIITFSGGIGEPTVHALSPWNEWLAVSVSMFFLAGLILIARSFLWQEKIESDLGMSRQHLNAIIKHSDDAIVTKSLEGIIRSWNPAAERIFGYTAEEIIGKSINTIIPPELQNDEREILAAISRGQRVDHLLTERVTKDGARKNVSISTSPIKNSSGRIVGAAKIARDITAQKRHQDAILESEIRYKKLAEEISVLLGREQIARRQVEQANRMKDQFLATLSHELRTPLNAILGWAFLARRQSDPEKLKEGLTIVERNARSQARIIEDLLDMNRIMSGMLRLDIKDVSVPTVIQEAVESVAPAAQAKEIHLESTVESRAEEVRADANRLKQMIWNLLVNAVKFTPAGGTVRIHAHRTQTHIEIMVSDTGKGISPDFIPHIFDRFSQADSSSTRQHGGLGLGLSIVKQLVELHGGRVEVRSEGEGKGATFTLSLPIPVFKRDLHGATEGELELPAAGEFGEVSSLGGLLVLVVDDEEDSRGLVKGLLEEKGARVLTASSAAEGLELLSQQAFNVIISDIGMPHEDGFQFIRRVRKLPSEQKGTIPAIALSAYARQEDRTAALEAGFHLHLSKPVEPSELLGAVSRVVGPAVVPGP
ncbi:MAG: PAS domain S-box protein [Deltaproteobacteria bacterium]|nr:PAS domain S-box protein [Deltaproteobacteria bacterium]